MLPCFSLAGHCFPVADFICNYLVRLHVGAFPAAILSHDLLLTMFTPCANSKLKHKRDKKQTETQCWEEEEQENHGNKILEDPSLKGGLIKKTKLQECDESMGPEEDGTTMMGLAGIPVAPCYRGSKGGIYFVLQNASLVAAYVGKRYQILNPDEHANFLRRKNKNPYDYRPDIVHEALLQIMGSRLCMAGRVHGVFIKTDEGILIRVEPNTQIPKTLGSFCNMMAELLQKFSIKSKGNRGKLLRLIENPVTQHLPVNSRKIVLGNKMKATDRDRDMDTNFSAN
ncbi:hypothetical protein Ahy_B02g058669 isoform B [Arachis hypogaea]|uniref:Ribosomal RNA small subunit methyltransferase nep-1 n=2 Tax=Arachis hypogaea TaxID=3818 RepID=A0A445AF26_ARAHY|nr:hypothetical protein Ahy_B02g058669 isoform B [Arachis hypogaea]